MFCDSFMNMSMGTAVFLSVSAFCLVLLVGRVLDAFVTTELVFEDPPQRPERRPSLNKH